MDATGPMDADGPLDADLVRAAQRGEAAAFEALVKRHQDRAWRIAKGMVGDREEARDLAQEAFLRVFRALDRFDFQHEFSTWLSRIVSNLAIDHLRRRRPLTDGLEGEDDELRPTREDESAPRPGDRLEQLETAALVRECIDRLAPHFRSVMILRELEGLACAEIAEIVGATQVTVRWRLHRGRKLFQEEWSRIEARRLGEAAPARTPPRESSHGA
ncbi:MAG: sigma-70 family RNA polymerase sigma factor [Planctomycetota bacterium]